MARSRPVCPEARPVTCGRAGSAEGPPILDQGFQAEGQVGWGGGGAQGCAIVGIWGGMRKGAPRTVHRQRQPGGRARGVAGTRAHIAPLRGPSNLQRLLVVVHEGIRYFSLPLGRRPVVHHVKGLAPGHATELHGAGCKGRRAPRRLRAGKRSPTLHGRPAWQGVTQTRPPQPKLATRFQ